jgi:D-3-phosphoglycerate dehydrogenase
MTRIAVTSRSFSRHPILREELSARYPSVTFNEAGEKLDGSSLIKFLGGHDRAITALEPITEDVLQALPELEVISKYGVGFDMIDLGAVRRHGVRLGWTGGVNKRSVSELVISSAIALLRNLPTAVQEVQEGKWRQIKGCQISDRTVGIIGCGNVGKDLAQLLRGFGTKILVNDIRDYGEFYSQYDLTPVTLETLLQQSDIVTLHVPLDDSTRNLLSERQLKLMKKDSIIINVARGGIIDESAVKMMLMDSKLGGAVFDVFASEPPEDRDLLALPNVIATPHIGGSSEEAILAMGRAAIDGLETAVVPGPGFGEPT